MQQLEVASEQGKCYQIGPGICGNSAIGENSSNSAMSQHGGGTMHSEFHREVEGCLVKRLNFHERKA
jgi:hypothetical protein